LNDLLGIVVARGEVRGGSLQGVAGATMEIGGQVFVDLGLGIALLVCPALLAPYLADTRMRMRRTNRRFLLPQSSMEMAVDAAFGHGGDCEEAIYALFAAALGALTRKRVGGSRFGGGVGGAHLYRSAPSAVDCSVALRISKVRTLQSPPLGALLIKMRPANKPAAKARFPTHAFRVSAPIAAAK